MFTKFAQEIAAEDEGTWVPLKNHLGEAYQNADGTSPRLLVLGPYSTAVRKAEEAGNRRIKMTLRRGGDADAERAVRERAAAAIGGWEHLQGDDGTPAPYTPANALALVTAAPWVAEQVLTVLNAYAAFFDKG